MQKEKIMVWCPTCSKLIQKEHFNSEPLYCSHQDWPHVCSTRTQRLQDNLSFSFRHEFIKATGIRWTRFFNFKEEDGSKGMAVSKRKILRTILVCLHCYTPLIIAFCVHLAVFFFDSTSVLSLFWFKLFFLERIFKISLNLGVYGQFLYSVLVA